MDDHVRIQLSRETIVLPRASCVALLGELHQYDSMRDVSEAFEAIEPPELGASRAGAEGRGDSTHRAVGRGDGRRPEQRSAAWDLRAARTPFATICTTFRTIESRRRALRSESRCPRRPARSRRLGTRATLGISRNGIRVVADDTSANPARMGAVESEVSDACGGTQRSCWDHRDVRVCPLRARCRGVRTRASVHAFVITCTRTTCGSTCRNADRRLLGAGEQDERLEASIRRALEASSWSVENRPSWSRRARKEDRDRREHCALRRALRAR